MPEVHEPKKSKRFWDEASQREMMLNLDEGGWYGWLFYRHPDGEWVSVRKATEQELFRLGVPVPQKVPEIGQNAQAPPVTLEEHLYMESMRNRDSERQERRYRDRRERFALAVFRSLILQDAADRRTKELIVPSDWRQLAKEAISAADALEEELNPTGPVLPDYEA